MMTAMHPVQTAPSGAGLSLAFALGWTAWQVGVRTGLAGAPRLRTMRARDRRARWDEVARAQQRCGVPDDAGVSRGDEAGRDGFWRHRCLLAHGLHNVVVDAASMEGKRRGRRTKTDRLDASTWRTMLIRHCPGAPTVWRVVHVPSVTAADRRPRHRDLAERQTERTPHRHRITGLLARCGLAVPESGDDVPERLQG